MTTVIPCACVLIVRTTPWVGADSWLPALIALSAMSVVSFGLMSIWSRSR